MVVARLLVIDDEADVELAKLVDWKDRVETRVLQPGDVGIDDIEFANVIVVDYRLDEPWKERDSSSCIALQPMNGLALCAVLRGHEQLLSCSPVAFLLRSAHLTDLSPQFPPDSRLHVIAAQNNLEWVFSKQGKVDQQMGQISCLSDAIEVLPESWPKSDSSESKRLLAKWLEIPHTESWSELAWNDVEECHPPLHELHDNKHGMRLIRWMLHSILSYPCFLWSPIRLAARLRVDHKSLLDALPNGLQEFFALAQYGGALSGFEDQPRWWGRGIESALWTLTEGQSFDSDATISALNELCKGALAPLTISQPVLCLNSDYRFRPEPCEISDAVRVQPDDWPAFAEQAWASIADVRKEPRLESVVISADRDRMESADCAEEGE